MVSYEGSLLETRLVVKRLLQCSRLDSDDSDDDGFVVVQYERVAGESGDRDKGSMACGSDSKHKAEKIVIKLRKK